MRAFRQHGFSCGYSIAFSVFILDEKFYLTDVKFIYRIITFERSGIDVNEIDEVDFGQCRQSSDASNIARYAALKAEHEADFGALYGRVELDLGGMDADRARTTDALKSDYLKGAPGAYLEETFFQYGRYLLISSSRPGTMPANLQGTWTCGSRSPWGAGYWQNLNVQMNYRPAFSCNLAECFRAYADFMDSDDASLTIGPELMLKDEHNEWGKKSRPEENDPSVGLGMQFSLDF